MEFENEYIKIHLNDGIMHVKYAEDIDITLDVAKECVEARLKISNGVTYPMLVDLRGLAGVSKDARLYFASEESTRHILCGAFLLRTTVQVIISNFFIHFDKPLVETKLFHREEEALKWLKTKIV